MEPSTSAQESLQPSASAESDELPAARAVPEFVRALADGHPKPRAKEQEVLDVATDYFLKHGYEGASINAMARSSGISKESIYRYFSSKKQLFEAVIGRELIEYQNKLRRLDGVLETMDLREALVTIGETVLGVVVTDRNLALRRLIFEESTRSPDLGQHYYHIGPEQAFAALERLISSHRLNSKFDAKTLSLHFLAMISWRIVLERECAVRPAPTKDAIREWVETIVDDFMKAFIDSK